MRVYCPQTGAPYDGEPVDCADLMRLGGYTREPPANPPLAAAKPAAPDNTADADAKAKLEADAKAKLELVTEQAEAMNVPALKDALAEAEIEVPHGSLKADLVQLLIPVLLAAE